MKKNYSNWGRSFLKSRKTVLFCGRSFAKNAITILFFILSSNFINSQCTNSAYGQYGTLTPVCGSATNGAWATSANNCWNGEYSIVNVTAGSTYEFQTYRSNSPTFTGRYATITTTANTPIVWGNTSTTVSITWTATFTGQVWFYTHLANTCGTSNQTATRRVRCSTPVVACTPPALAGFGNNLWNVECYDGNNFNTYKGFYTENNLSFNSANRWGTGSTPSAANATGGNAYVGCPIPVENHSYIYKRQGFPADNYVINVNRDDDYILLVNGVQVNAGACCGWTNNAWSGTLNSTSTVEVRFREYGGGSQGEIQLITTTPPVNDACVNATNLPCGTSSLAGTTVNSVSETAPSGCASPYGVWYTFMGDGLETTISSSTTFDHELTIESGTCGSLSNVACIDNSTGTESYTFTPTSGVQYFVYIAYWSTTNNTTGTFTISRSCATPPAWQSQWISMDTGVANWCAGETRNITVTVKNTGTNTWTNTSPDINIGVKWNNEANYLVLTNANDLVSGNTQTYTLSVTAPATSGFYKLNFDVINDGNFQFANNNNGAGPGNIVYNSLPIAIASAPNPVSAGVDASNCPATNTQLNGVATSVAINESFENVANLGWIVTNMSVPVGTASWFQGNPTVFAGQTNGYIGVNFNSTTGNNTISNWLISPEMTINNGDVISFYTRGPGMGFADRMQLRLNTNGSSVNVGTDANTEGDFTTLLLDINPTLAGNGYPGTWTQYSVTITGIPSSVSGRIAFRYFVTSGGPTGSNSDYVGIDDFTYTPVVNSIWTPSTALSSTTILNPVASPTVTTTYTLSANQMGCTNTSNVTITAINPSLTSLPTNGDMVWRGEASTDWATLGNWWQFNGSSYGAATTTPTAAQNVIVPATQTCVLNQPNTFANTGNAKSLRIENGASLTMGNGTLTIAENWVNNGTFNPGSGTVSFTGSGNNSISGSSATHAFNNLTMNKNGEIILSVPIIITGSLTLTDGRLNINNFNLDLPTNTLNGGGPNSFVKTSGTGTLNRNVGGSAVNFPVGRTAYNPATLTNSGTADKFSLRVIDDVTDIGTNADAGPTTSLAVVKRTWMINEQVAGGSNVTLGLNWNGAGEQINGFQATDAFIAHYMAGSGLWDNIGGAVTTNSIVTGGITSFSPFTISSSLVFAPLPVELMSFTSVCLDNDVAIKWSTASENNSMHFVVETSTDALNWDVLSVIPAAQFSTSILNYAITHEGAAREKNYYRLKQVDLDGAFEYYNIIYSNCGNYSGIPVTFPNPSNGDFTIDFSGAEMKGVVQLSIMNTEGKEISFREVNLEEGVSTYQFINKELQPGIYYLKIVDTAGRSFIIKHSFI